MIYVCTLRVRHTCPSPVGRPHTGGHLHTPLHCSVLQPFSHYAQLPLQLPLSPAQPTVLSSQRTGRSEISQMLSTTHVRMYVRTYTCTHTHRQNSYSARTHRQHITVCSMYICTHTHCMYIRISVLLRVCIRSGAHTCTYKLCY